MSPLHHFCPLCATSNVFQTFSTLFAHIRKEHREEPLFNIRCELSPFCGSRYSSFDSYRRHIYRCHRSLIDAFHNDDIGPSNIDDILNNVDNSLSDFTLNNVSDFNIDPEERVYPDEELDDEDREYLNFNPVNLSINTQQCDFEQIGPFYVRFLLELREFHLLPQKVVQSISSNISTLMEMIIKLVKSKTSSVSSSVDIDTVFADVIRIINHVSKNEYAFLNECKKHFNYQPPIEIVLNPTEERAYYIPLRQSVSYMLQSGQLLEAIVNNIESLTTRASQDKDLLLSNRQSRSVESRLSHQTNSNTLLLKLYTDGIGITNPIGPKKDAHKFTCFYYLLDDLPELIRSKVNSIGLHCIAYTKHLNQDTTRTTLMNVLVEDLNQLQTEGISIPRLSSRVYFLFAALCADNLGSHEAGGFQRNFNSGNFCRHCLVTYQQRHIPLTDISFVPRTRVKHEMIINQILASDDGQVIQGVRSLSWYRDLIGFHPTESLPPDIMHDFAEGNKIHQRNESESFWKR